MNLVTGCILVLIVSAEPTAQQLSLLKTFRSEFVAIAPGTARFPKTFAMGRRGEAEPVHPVTMSGPFQIARYEVPQNLWEAVMGNNPSKWKGARNSVEMVNFDEAEVFCQRATELMRAARLIDADQEVRLPSEAEWEYCARAGTTTLYSFGDDENQLNDYAWSTQNAKGNDPPIGAKKPNPWGLYDIHGYLWEWCRDRAHEDYQGAPVDGSAWTTGGDADKRIIRGGSWKDIADRLKSSYRAAVPRRARDDAIGLRCVLAQVPAGGT
jgi:formylglycine-generating enzyme required for sulfatase activity